MLLRTLCGIMALCLAAAGRQAAAFVSVGSERLSHRSSALHLQKSHDRRTFLVRLIASPALSAAAAATTAVTPPRPAQAAVPLLMDKSSPDVPPFSGDSEAAKKRFRRAIRDVDDLLANYDEITRTGGDNVRLYLGTQGVKSNMYGILKVLGGLREEAEDIVEYTEAMNEFEAFLFQADGAAYQSLFAEFSSAKIAPGSLMKTARGDIVNMRKFMSDLATQLNLEL
jgi:hypothetical protein